jgi:hypothetical protein
MARKLDDRLEKNAVAIQLSLDTATTSDEMASILDGITALHDLLVEEDGLPPVPLTVRKLTHPNSAVIVASLWLIVHSATFIAFSKQIGKLAEGFMAWRTARHALRKAELDLEKARTDLERTKLEKEIEQLKQRAAVPEPNPRVRIVYKEAKEIAASVPDLKDDERADLLASIIDQKMSLEGVGKRVIVTAKAAPPPG